MSHSDLVVQIAFGTAEPQTRNVPDGLGMITESRCVYRDRLGCIERVTPWERLSRMAFKGPVSIAVWYKPWTWGRTEEREVAAPSGWVW